MVKLLALFPCRVKEALLEFFPLLRNFIDVWGVSNYPLFFRKNIGPNL